jgi:outer membrane protein
MTKHLPVIAFAFIALLATSQAQLKIATIDMQKAFAEYYKTKEAEDLLKGRMGDFKKEEQEMMSDYQKLVDEINKLREAGEDKTLAEAAREEKRKAFQMKAQDAGNMERKIQEFRVTRSRQFEDQSRRMRSGIVEEIQKIVVDISTKEKYSLVFDKSGMSVNGTPVLIHAQDVKDLTDDVTKMMNAAKPVAAKSESKPAEKK